MSYSIDIEKDIIGLIFSHNELHAEIFNIPPTHFQSSTIRNIFVELSQMYSKNDPISLMTIKKSYLGLIVQCIEGSGAARSQLPLYKKAMLENYNKKKINKILTGIPANYNSNQMVEYIESEINQIQGNNEDTFRSITQLISSHGNELAYKKMTQSVLNTGFIDIDKKIIVKNGDLVIVAGRPSMGKTAISLYIAMNMAKQNIPVGFFSLEMRGEYLLKRLARAKGKYFGYEGYKDGCSKLNGIPLYIDDASKYNLNNLKNQIQMAVKKYKVKAIFIDYLTLLEPPEAQNMSIAVGIMSRSLKAYAKRFNIPIIIISQLSRNVEHRKEKRPQLSDLRESGAIEQDADLVLFTYIPYNYGIISDKSGKSLENYMEIIIAKQRDGAINTVKLFYDREKQYFSNWGNAEETT